MTFKKWLRKIALFPLSIIMGVPGDDEGFNADALAEIAGPEGPTLGERIMALAGDPNAQFVVNQDAAASQDNAADADQQGNQGNDATEGLGTPPEKGDQDADLDNEGDADDSTTTETDESGERKKGTNQRTIAERAAEIAAKIVEERLSKQTVEKPDFAPAEVVANVKLNIVKHQAKIRELEADIELDGDDADMEKVDELLKLQEFVTEAKAALKENDKRRTEWEARQAAKKTNDDHGATARKELDEAAELYRSEMKIEKATWDKMGVWFESQMATQPLLVAEFNDVYEKKGKVAAIRFAHGYAVEHMGKATKQANQQKEQSKNTTAGLTTSTTGKVAPLDLNKIRKEFADNPTDDNFVRLQEAKRQAKAG